MCLFLGTIGLIVPTWKFDVLETSISAREAEALEAPLLGQILVFRISSLRRATITRWFLDRNTLFSLNENGRLGILFYIEA